MPRTKTFTKEDTDSMDTPYTKQMVRTFSNSSDLMKGIDSVYAVDQEISHWHDMGYDLFATHYLGMTADGYSMMYILVYKGQPAE